MSREWTPPDEAIDAFDKAFNEFAGDDDREWTAAGLIAARPVLVAEALAEQRDRIALAIESEARRIETTKGMTWPVGDVWYSAAHIARSGGDHA